MKSGQNRSQDLSLTGPGVPHIVAYIGEILKSCAMRRWAVLLLGLWLGSCANLDKFYTPETADSYPPTQSVAVVDAGQDAEAAYASMYRTPNYRRIGQINFVGAPFGDDDFADLGRRVGADVVVVSRQFQGARVVDDSARPGDPGSQSTYGLNPSSGSEPGFSPNTIVPQSPSSYVVRDYRQRAIYLRRVTPPG
jgi:hypothetical protein